MKNLFIMRIPLKDAKKIHRVPTFALDEMGAQKGPRTGDQGHSEEAGRSRLAVANPLCCVVMAVVCQRQRSMFLF